MAQAIEKNGYIMKNEYIQQRRWVPVSYMKEEQSPKIYATHTDFLLAFCSTYKVIFLGKNGRSVSSTRQGWTVLHNYANLQPSLCLVETVCDDKKMIGKLQTTMCWN